MMTDQELRRELRRSIIRLRSWARHSTHYFVAGFTAGAIIVLSAVGAGWLSGLLSGYR